MTHTFIRRASIRRASVGSILIGLCVGASPTLHGSAAPGSSVEVDSRHRARQPSLAAPSDTAAPRILIFGTEHLAHREPPRPETQIEEVVRRLEAFRPDMVVVEYLPPDWPKGQGRDYRPGFDLGAYAERWGVAPERAGAVLDSLDAAGALDGSGACRRARLLFVQRDLVNAAYAWGRAECPAEADPGIAAWLDEVRRHEIVRMAFPIARASGLDRLVSFDYQGRDAEWFIEEFAQRTRKSGPPRARRRAASFLDTLERSRAQNDTLSQAPYPEVARELNSKRWVDRQKHFYEDVLPRLRHERAGRHQLDHYWLRNYKMFENIREAARREHPDRILVVVGAGHKYFLDELAREAGWRLVDALDYLP